MRGYATYVRGNSKLPARPLLCARQPCNDKYEYDFVILPHDVLQVELCPTPPPTRKARRAVHPHNKFSDATASTTPVAIVRLAYRKGGDRAIAIKHHGVRWRYRRASVATDVHETAPESPSDLRVRGLLTTT